ncbi:hypothetical protein WJX81_007721 [Elliptochloris bilobata]|uniref:Uncharacterized protein n=1 Tax=Elliptochloris bilobata TaxID=381761 RepID=A0AAW1RDU7_9CHLO
MDTTLQPAHLKADNHQEQLALIASTRQHVETARAFGLDVLEALAAGGPPAEMAQRVAAAIASARQAAAAADAGLMQCFAAAPAEAGRAGCAAAGPAMWQQQEAATLQSSVARQAADALAAFDAGLNPLRAALDPGGSTSASRPSCIAAEATELRMAVPGVLMVAVALARGAAQRVAVFGAEEAPPLGGKDAWGTSEGVVFRRLSDMATRALAHFEARAEHVAGSVAGEVKAGSAAQIALEDLLLWLSSYRDLFTRPCVATGRLLAADPALQLLLPPLVRPFRHVPRSRLLAAARAPETLPAFHLRAVPAGTL